MGRKAITRDRKQDSTKKQEWANALFPFFQQHGVKGVTINTMAKWLGKSKSTLYEYFVSKDEILLFSILSKIQALQGYELILKDTNRSFQQRYKDFFQYITKQVSDISNLFLADLKLHFPNHWILVDNFLTNLIGQLDVYYKQGIAAGEFSNINVALLLAEDRYFVFDILTNPEFLEENNLTLKELVQEYLNLKLYGLAHQSKKSHK